MIGLSNKSVSRLVANDDLKQVGRGIYFHPDAELDDDVGFRITFAKCVTKAAIGCLSALIVM